MNMSIPHNAASGNKPERSDFLRALYVCAPDELYIELRCIHPVTGDARSCWSRIGDKRSLAAAFTRATALNHEGYGVYFAPCLRATKSGKAEAAALLPALWVDLDCDDDPTRRAAALERLHTFNPPPSAVIDSGGGLHAYWLLDALVTMDEISRKQAAGILRGLFAALGGDPQYVKSVASVMRLIGTVNTKPERGGVVVTLVELHADRRYPLADFAWLESQPTPERAANTMPTPHLNGHHPLPRRTEDYLTSGAPEGSRNAQLFAAACQMRDAGYTQSETEGQLVPRYVADGCSEREALATIASVYSRAPREPIPTYSPRQQVDTLVSRYSKDQLTPERPSAAEIAETVRSCAALDPVAWAEARQRLKLVCGEGLKFSDLDRLYREARRSLERTAAPQTDSAERYVERDGCMVYEKETERGVTRQTVADWTARVLESMTRVDDDGQVERQMRVQFTHSSNAVTVDTPDELFGDPNALARFIAGRAGGLFTSRAGMHKHLAPAIIRLSGDVPRRETYGFVGWTQIEGRWAFVSPEVSISAAGTLAMPPEVTLENRLHGYGLREPQLDRGVEAVRAAAAVFPKELASTLIAFALLPLVQRFFPSAAPKPALHLVGTTGSGKSEIAALMTSFYGSFTRDTPPGQWGDTVNTVEALGYTLADVLYWVDDYKTSYADEKTFTRFLQSYSRGMGRGRLTREAKLRQERPCRGLLLSTGETTIEGEASILSRMIVLEVPPWEKRDPKGETFSHADRLRRNLPAFTAAFVQWIAGRADAGTLASDLSERYELNSAGYRDKLHATLGRQANTGRMVNNWAVLVTVYQLVREFLAEHGVDDALPIWQDSIVETVQAVQQERAGRVFLDLLGQLVASGRVMFASNMQMPEEPRPGMTIIGYHDGAHVLLLPDIAFQEVARSGSLRFSATDIGKQLREDGWLIPGANSLTVQRRVRSIATRFWQLKADFMTCDGCDTVTD
jgi:hypothetical protein